MTKQQRDIIADAAATIRGYQKANEALAKKDRPPTVASEKLRAIYVKKSDRERRQADALERLLR